jgi:hypothetical protein
MISYKDRSYCASPGCQGECGRQLTEEVKEGAKNLGLLISTAYFCGIPDYIRTGNTVRRIIKPIITNEERSNNG